LQRTFLKVVIPGLASERSEARSVGNDDLYYLRRLLANVGGLHRRQFVAD